MTEKTVTTTIPIFQGEGKICGLVEIPNDVLSAASRVYAWMRAQPNPHSVRLNGLKLSEKDDLDDRI